MSPNHSAGQTWATNTSPTFSTGPYGAHTWNFPTQDAEASVSVGSGSGPENMPPVVPFREPIAGDPRLSASPYRFLHCYSEQWLKENASQPPQVPASAPFNQCATASFGNDNGAGLQLGYGQFPPNSSAPPSPHFVCLLDPTAPQGNTPRLNRPVRTLRPSTQNPQAPYRKRSREASPSDEGPTPSVKKAVWPQDYPPCFDIRADLDKIVECKWAANGRKCGYRDTLDNFTELHVMDASGHKHDLDRTAHLEVFKGVERTVLLCRWAGCELNEKGRFIDKDNFLRHVKDTHLQESYLECYFCKYRARGDSYRKRHGPALRCPRLPYLLAGAGSPASLSPKPSSSSVSPSPSTSGSGTPSPFAYETPRYASTPTSTSTRAPTAAQPSPPPASPSPQHPHTDTPPVFPQYTEPIPRIVPSSPRVVSAPVTPSGLRVPSPPPVPAPPAAPEPVNLGVADSATQAVAGFLDYDFDLGHDFFNYFSLDLGLDRGFEFDPLLDLDEAGADFPEPSGARLEIVG
ncbi:uncharacterized protein BXZ73DRAFT_106181 [Epithele typhae]|uniref:uncharacterized protein n=1 Tax=Epithele typhae TaxID=378194 RepID=UPI00200856D8|nr:uncharacterized protein BXZ73DRAFT_106181 [Epithele typhae]KAH9915452.1 hypothetical protein BXZ73DRAFT_106181 [Epithele typhae]